MALSCSADLVELLGKLQLLEPSQVALCIQGKSDEPKSLIQELLRRKWLTPYQARQITQGHGDQLVLGPYLGLDRLGDGGMGQDFKARHRNLNRPAALKVIRRELVADAAWPGFTARCKSPAN